MKHQFVTIQALWRFVCQIDPEQMFFRIPAQGSGPSQARSYRMELFYKQALKVAYVLKNQFAVKAGERIAVLVESSVELSMILHGIWLGRFVAVPISMDLSSKAIADLLNDLKIQTVIYPPEATGKVAAMFSAARAVRNWIVTGSSQQPGRASGVPRLDDYLALARAEEPAEEKFEVDCEALIILSRGTTGGKARLCFSQEELIGAARAVSDSFPANDSAKELIWSALPTKTLYGLLITFLVPLFSGVPCLLAEEIEVRKFWDHVQANDVSFAVLDQVDLRIINRRGKSRSWIKPRNLEIMLFTRSLLDSLLLSNFSKRFRVPICTCYTYGEAGGVIAAFPRGRDNDYVNEWYYDYEVPSSGIQVNEADFIICDMDGQPVEEETLGEILVSSDRMMKLARPEDCRVSYLHTGDQGFYVRDGEGLKHLFVTGRLEELIIRNETRVNPAPIDNEILNIRGVEFGRAVGFPNLAAGHEIGAYIVLVAAANLTEKEILSQLRQHLEWHECPKAVVFGRRSTDGRIPKRSELEHLFEKYYDADFLFED